MLAMTAGEVAAFAALAFSAMMALLGLAVMWGKTITQLAELRARVDRMDARVECAKRRSGRAISRTVRQAHAIIRLARKMSAQVDEQALIRGSARYSKRERRAER